MPTHVCTLAAAWGCRGSRAEAVKRARRLATGVHASPRIGQVCTHRLAFPAHARQPRQPPALARADANPRHLPLRVYIEVKEAGQLEVRRCAAACLPAQLAMPQLPAACWPNPEPAHQTVRRQAQSRIF